MGKHSPDRPPRILHEIRTSLPGQHIPTSAEEPENGDSPESLVYTGQEDTTALTNRFHSALGVLFGLAWLVWGVYTWWFVDRTITDFVVAAAIWIVAFAVGVVGIPIIRQAGINQFRR